MRAAKEVVPRRRLSPTLSLHLNVDLTLTMGCTHTRRRKLNESTFPSDIHCTLSETLHVFAAAQIVLVTQIEVE